MCWYLRAAKVIHVYNLNKIKITLCLLCNCTFISKLKKKLFISFYNIFYPSYPVTYHLSNIAPYFYYIIKINENATLVFSISFQNGLVNQNCVLIIQSFFTYSIKRFFFVLIDCQYALFKNICSKTSYLNPCNAPHEWFVFFHRAHLADWVDNIFPTCVLHIKIFED